MTGSETLTHRNQPQRTIIRPHGNGVVGTFISFSSSASHDNIFNTKISNTDSVMI